VLSTLRSGATTVKGQVGLQQSGGDRSVAWEGLGGGQNGDWMIPFQFNVSVVAPVVAVSLENAELGRTGSEPLLTTVLVSCDQAAQNAGTVVKASLVPATENPFPLMVPDHLYLLSGPTAAAAGELQIDCGKVGEQDFLVAVAPAEIVGDGLPWNWPWQAHRFGGSLVSSSSPGASIEGEQLAFSFETQVAMPVGLRLLVGFAGVLLAAVIGLALYSFLGRPRFAPGLAVSVDGAPRKELRKLQKKGLFKVAVTVGSSRDDLNLGLEKTVGKLLPQRGKGCFVIPLTDEWSAPGTRLTRAKKQRLPGAPVQIAVHGHSLRFDLEKETGKKDRRHGRPDQDSDGTKRKPWRPQVR